MSVYERTADFVFGPVRSVAGTLSRHSAGIALVLGYKFDLTRGRVLFAFDPGVLV